MHRIVGLTFALSVGGVRSVQESARLSLEELFRTLRLEIFSSKGPDSAPCAPIQLDSIRQQPRLVIRESDQPQGFAFWRSFQSWSDARAPDIHSPILESSRPAKLHKGCRLTATTIDARWLRMRFGLVLDPQ